jgi:threo-3-hydroxy-L-aspartate ammonia-lyase
MLQALVMQRSTRLPATIIMPKDAPELKVRATKGYGAGVIFYDR